MARTTEEIRQQVTDTYVANMAAIGIAVDTAAWSKTNLQKLIIYVVSFCISTLELLFDVHKAEIDATIKELKPHTTRWYANKALEFQYGFSLLADDDEFDNSGYTDSQIEDSKVVDYAAVVEQVNTYGRVSLRIKIAHDNGTDLEPVTDPQKSGFTEYLQRIKDAGVRLQIDSLPADSLKQKWRIFYDPLLLSGSGARLDGASAVPVEDAIKNYLKNLPFNGVYVSQFHIDAVQAVEGVVTCELDLCQSKYGLLPFSNVDALFTPDSGYLRFATDPDLEIEYIAQSAIK